MKKLLLILLLVPYLTLGQWAQLANDMDGLAGNDQSGYAVDLNADGNILAIGAPFNDANGNVSGNVRVFENQAGSWVQLGPTINGSAALDRSGSAVSISDDGTIIAIGAPDKTSNGFESGQVRIFENQAGTWNQIGDEIIGEAFSDHSGFSVSLSGDGTTVAIGAPDNEGTSGGNFGHVRVFENQAGTWTQIGDDIDGEAAEDNSGYAVSISQDGSIVAIGAPFNDGTSSSAGHVRVYQNQSGTWEQIGDDIDGEAMNDRFGSSVKLSANGIIVAIGAYDNNGIGHVRVLENQSGTWVQVGDDIDGDAITERFGFSIDLSADGTIVAIGAPLSDEGGIEKGRVEIYQNQSGTWTQIDQNIEGEALNDRSGYSVSLSANGAITAVGAHLNDGNGANSGHARVFANSNILGVLEDDFLNEFKVYPNPAATHVTLNFGRIHTTIDIAVYDALGRKITTQSYKNHEVVALNIQNLSKGIYHVEIHSSGTGYSVLKFIKE